MLKGKKILITGISNKFSIAFGIAKVMYAHGAELAFTCRDNQSKKKILSFASELGSNIVVICNVTKDKNIKNLFAQLFNIWGTFDGFVHSIAFASKINLSGNYVNTITKSIFETAHNISSYSFVAMARECKDILNKNSSLVTLSYLGSQRVVPYYNVMGLAKASLESNMRYMANALGSNDIRVNAISSAPIKTVSACGIKKFKKILNIYPSMAPIRKPITSKDIGNTASFLCSDLSRGITGQIIYVDGGFNITSMNLSDY
ncbi:Enoyl-[acyl-carrier-protein] reductase [NADH] FabI [Buchnera aphidicola (Pemphigus populi)]